MPGRGDNNKKGTSGQGGSNQSGQGFEQTSNREKASHGESTGDRPSEPQRKQQDQDSNRNTSLKKEKK
ncbi:MAG: hypothetical protein H0W75_06665 [Chitinophagaceae bacterium]|nr:hypothetical protein [Chitinophagaceae bacterium]